MHLPALQGRRLLAAVAFIAATLALCMQFINPSPVVVSVGSDGATTTTLGTFFTYSDAALIAVAGCVFGASGTYLLTNGKILSDQPRETGLADQSGAGVMADESSTDGTPSEDLLERRRAEWEETADRLANNERDVYETVLDADGVLPQSDIVERTDLSKATVSRALDGLETKNLVERKRRGMGNVVLLL